MSRSTWALAEARRRGPVVRVAGERRRFDGRSRRGPRLLPFAVSATKCAAVLVASGMLVMAAEPARALAAPGRSTQSNQAVKQVVLAPGSGYGGGKDAALVRSLQRRLDGQGYSPGPLDGRYGPRTEHAVEMFQSARGLRADGITGPLTLAALRTTVIYPGTGYAGAASSKVRGLQRQLRRDGFNPGPIDGRYGPLTEGAVRRLQAAHGLQVDGIAGSHTFGELKRIAGSKRLVTRPAPGARRTTPARPRPRRNQTTKPSHPVAPRATKPGGAGLPVVLVLAAVLALAALASGVWLIDRRRRTRAIMLEPEPAPENGHAGRFSPSPRPRTVMQAGFSPSPRPRTVMQAGFSPSLHPRTVVQAGASPSPHPGTVMHAGPSPSPHLVTVIPTTRLTIQPQPSSPSVWRTSAATQEPPAISASCSSNEATQPAPRRRTAGPTRGGARKARSTSAGSSSSGATWRARSARIVARTCAAMRRRPRISGGCS